MVGAGIGWGDELLERVTGSSWLYRGRAGAVISAMGDLLGRLGMALAAIQSWKLNEIPPGVGSEELRSRMGRHCEQARPIAPECLQGWSHPDATEVRISSSLERRPRLTLRDVLQPDLRERSFPPENSLRGEVGNLSLPRSTRGAYNRKVASRVCRGGASCALSRLTRAEIST